MKFQVLFQGVNWVLEEGITMDECKEQPKHTVISYPMGVIPEFGNFYAIWKVLFPYISCLIVLKPLPTSWIRNDF